MPLMVSADVPMSARTSVLFGTGSHDDRPVVEAVLTGFLPLELDRVARSDTLVIGHFGTVDLAEALRVDG